MKWWEWAICAVVFMAFGSIYLIHESPYVKCWKEGGYMQQSWWSVYCVK